MSYSSIKNFEFRGKLTLLGIPLILEIQCDISKDPTAGFYCNANIPDKIKVFNSNNFVIHSVIDKNKGPSFMLECRPYKLQDGFKLKFDGGVNFFGLSAQMYAFANPQKLELFYEVKTDNIETKIKYFLD